MLANVAQVSEGSFVYDPFVGSASTLIACSHFGAFTFGSDIDMRVLLGTSVGRMSYDNELTESVIKNAKPGTKEAESKFDVFTNFKHYKKPTPGIFG